MSAVDVGGAGAPVVAVVGMVGTLLSALLTQRAAERSRRHEQERAERARARDSARAVPHLAERPHGAV
ncbi:hypothetical protein [Streptomyces misionensis]|uniref:hypothetical protein n=1 Tax=Streptomyces misionensis TaxID=67331 RepID=UPI0033F099E8